MIEQIKRFGKIDHSVTSRVLKEYGVALCDFLI
jgi:hypothetical protein